MRKKIWLLSFVVPLLLYGGGSDLQSRIEKLQSAPKAERFKLMNEIKRELAQMNAEQRKIALRKLMRVKGMHHEGNSKGQGMHTPASRGEHMRQNMQNHHDNMNRQHIVPPKHEGNDRPSVPKNRPEPGKHSPTHRR